VIRDADVRWRNFGRRQWTAWVCSWSPPRTQTPACSSAPVKGFNDDSAVVKTSRSMTENVAQCAGGAARPPASGTVRPRSVRGRR